MNGFSGKTTANVRQRCHGARPLCCSRASEDVETRSIRSHRRKRLRVRDAHKTMRVRITVYYAVVLFLDEQPRYLRISSAINVFFRTYVQ